MIRRASIDDLADIVPLFDAYRIFYGQASDLERARLFLDARLNNQESIIFIAYQDDRAVGFTQLYPTYSSVRTHKSWILNDLYVAATARKTGIGESLINSAIAFAKADGTDVIQLETQIDNSVAQGLYLKMGFVLQERGTDFLLFKKSI
ncbi:GNAT family N-acetyltransferase [Sphingobacterium psychroaquaticum]|uniref:Ribosomal protein S18 acetylase RimI n=1 Tax=Sphingobacterium psychroaquaticum TaxID=561061 RepID=A0A1X7K1P0_9SPHI|nr:GNAT family N-acetyltransferase [Sphingobacterium psychroaquaticum]SMG34575.1 Ribosomal protein S18 acetylase RimI [Sphingobacterium psychroaquaticum]